MYDHVTIGTLLWPTHQIFNSHNMEFIMTDKNKIIAQVNALGARLSLIESAFRFDEALSTKDKEATS